MLCIFSCIVILFNDDGDNVIVITLEVIFYNCSIWNKKYVLSAWVLFILCKMKGGGWVTVGGCMWYYDN